MLFSCGLVMATPDRNTIRDDDAITTHERDKRPSCSRCGKAFEERPLCDEDGTLRDRFLIGKHYQVDRLLAVREHAFVYRAQHTSGHAVLVTLARSEGTSPQFQRAQRLDHARLVEVLVADHDARLRRDFMVLDTPLSLSTRERLASTPLAIGIVTEALSDLARLLKEMGDDGAPHGGLSIDDLWIDPGSFRGLEVTGFCLGHRVADIGRPPERLVGEATEASDVYSFGAVAHQLLTCSMERAELRVPLSSRRVGVPLSLERLITSCLSLDALDRPTWDEVLLTLGKSMGDADTDVAIADTLLGTMVGSYRIEHQLGEGGMGRVYRGVHPRIGNHVAIKILHDEAAQKAGTVRRFEREAKATGAIGSPYIPQIFDFGTLPDGRPYAVMEFFSGESVRERVDAQGAMPLVEVRDALLTATEALSAAHAKQIVHRDVKPDNLFLVRGSDDAADSLRVLDFGIAKVSTPNKGTNLTREGSFLGTPMYCAPEQMYGLEPTPMMDVYALGATAYEMLTGECLYSGGVQEVLEKKASRQAPDDAPLSRLPRAVRRTVLKAIAHDPERRFQTMEEFADAVARWPLREATSVVTLARLGDKARTTWRWPLVALVSIALFGAAWMLVRAATSSGEVEAPLHETFGAVAAPTSVAPSEAPESEAAESEAPESEVLEPEEAPPAELQPEAAPDAEEATEAHEPTGMRRTRRRRVRPNMRRTRVTMMSGVVVANPFD